jgi:AcrR family transcriptional regulator
MLLFEGDTNTMVSSGTAKPDQPARTRVRATRAAGKQTRREILDAASQLFAQRGLSGVTYADIAEAASVFPSQVGYYFGSKEELFVEAACREMLHAAERVERAGARAKTPMRYVQAIVKTALESSAVLGFVEASLLVRRRPELAPLVARTFDQLHTEGSRAVAQNLLGRGWEIRATPAEEARGFWAAILGVALEQTARAQDPADESAQAAVRLVLNLYIDPDTGKTPAPVQPPEA